MSDQSYAFIKNNSVINIVLFDNPTEELLDIFKQEFGLDLILLANEKTAIDGTYDGSKFWLPQPYSSWVKNEELNEWEAPVPYPNDGNKYMWNEDILNWEEIQVSD